MRYGEDREELAKKLRWVSIFIIYGVSWADGVGAKVRMWGD